MTHLLNRISICGRVIAAFAAVLVCTISLGLFATQRLDAVNANALVIKNNWLPSTRILGRMAQVMERLRSNQGLQMLATTDAQRQQSVAIVKDQAALGTREVTANIVGVSEAATETGSAASQVLGVSAALSKEAEGLAGEVHGFVAAVQAA